MTRRNESDSLGKDKVFSIKLERTKDGFYTCPRCGAPSLYFNEMAKHVQEMHSIQVVRGASDRKHPPK